MIPRLRTIAVLMLLAGLSLGVFAARALRALGPGDLLLTFSDGLTESQDPDSEEFGEERLAETVRGCRDGNVQAIWQRIEEAVRDFVGEAPPFDDLTVTLVKRLR